MTTAHDPQLVDPVEFIPICDYRFSGDSRTVGNKGIFIEWYRRKASIFHAAAAARVARSTVYRWMEEDQQFAAAVQDSFEDAVDVMETSTYEDALGSKDRPGNALLKMFWLKAHRTKYRDKVTIDIDSVNSEIQERMQQLGMKQLPAALQLPEPVQMVQSVPPSTDLQKEGGGESGDG
jgi:hypothetical protein